MDNLDLVAFLSLITAVTQVVKVQLRQRGINLGEYTVILSFVLGGLGVYMMKHQIELWNSLVPIFLMFAGPGGVSLVKEVARKVNA